MTGDLIRARQRIETLSFFTGWKGGGIRLIYRVFVERFGNLPKFYLCVSFVSIKKTAATRVHDMFTDNKTISI